jgi:hypothetical protein
MLYNLQQCDNIELRLKIESVRPGDRRAIRLTVLRRSPEDKFLKRPPTAVRRLMRLILSPDRTLVPTSTCLPHAVQEGDPGD